MACTSAVIEGYTQRLCAAGHYSVQDAHEVDMIRCEIPGCGASLVWHNDVDQTNDDGEARHVHLRRVGYEINATPSYDQLGNVYFKSTPLFANPLGTKVNGVFYPNT